jgi:heterodisulfide reductase subunit C
MAHGTTRVQQHIGDPVSDKPPVTRAKLETIFKDIQSDLRYDHERNGCLNCGICTATCPAAHYYDFSLREIVQLLWIENLEGIYDAMQEKIWACAQCYTCAARCPFDNSPGGLIMLMRETAIKHNTESARNVLRPLSRLGRGQVNAGARHLGGRSVRGEDECGRLRRMCLRTPRTALASAI